VDTIVIHPFAHLFGELSSPEAAIEILTLIEEGLARLGFTVLRTPFGWFNTLELRAKGHPLSRIARQITLG
jgi:threonyl-tRNA synthetase